MTDAPPGVRPAARPQPSPGGIAELLKLIAWLLRRPRRTERRLPLIWLVRAAGHDALAPVLACLTRPPRRQVPHVSLDATRFADGADVRPLLDELHHQLALDAYGVAPLQFRHYPLACWLMGQTPPRVDVGDRRAWLAEQLRERRRRWSDSGVAPAGGETLFAVVYRFLVWLVRRAAPGVLFRAAVSGRVPLLGRHYRWFMRQQYLAPRQSVTFVGFAERLTAGRRKGEQPDQVNKLLVHAFLEDLRCAYARPPWRLAGWRRTAYPVLLLRDVGPGNAGHTLLRLMNDVRNETGRSDPLLVVASGDRAAVESIGAGPAGYDLDQARPAYDRWLEALPERRRLRQADAWHLPLDADGAIDGGQQPLDVSEFTVSPPPIWARRVVAAGVVLVLLAASALWASRRYGPDCWPQPLRGQVSVRLAGGQCIGYSDSAAHLFSGEQEFLRKIQERIFAQNRRAIELWTESDRRRPLITLVYLGDLTGHSAASGEVAYVSEREELEGMAVAQHARLETLSSTYGQALLRIVVANGGSQMRYVDQTVEMLAELAREDPTVLGVVGLVDSRDTTANALRRLNEIGMPAVAPNLSADGMSRNSSLYLQMVAANTDQAKLVSEYATKVLKVDEVHLYYTTGDPPSRLEEDLYVKTLVEAMQARFGERMTMRRFREGDSLMPECGYRGMLFFGGRYSQFDEFLVALRGCGDNPPAHLVADDSVNRYLANRQARATAPGNLPVTYVSKAALGMCSRLAVDPVTDETRRFLGLIRKPGLLPEARCVEGVNPQVGERVALAYDAAMMLLLAMEKLAARLSVDNRPVDPEAISPLALYTEVLRQNAMAPYPGVTGPVRFNPDTGEPMEKRISLMSVRSIPEATEEPQEIYFCGIARVGDPTGCHRP